MSDHCPLLLSTSVLSPRKRRFHFEAFWVRQDGFKEVVQGAWEAPCNIIDPTRRLDCKLRRTAKALQSWSDKKIGNVKFQLLMAKEIIWRFDLAEEKRLLSVSERSLVRALKKKVLALASLERTMARQRSRVSWLKEGDANTRFFHQHAAYRRRKNFIQQIAADGQLGTSQPEKERLVHEFFAGILGTSPSRSHSLNLSFFEERLAPMPDLDEPFSPEEILAAIKDSPDDKAPGPDGFTGLFYKSCWDTIQGDIVAAVDQLYRMDGSSFDRVNLAFITLLPK